MAMARTIVQHPNSGNEGGLLLNSPKAASSESSASEKAEDLGERRSAPSHHLRTSSAHPGAMSQFIGVAPRPMDDTVLDYDSGYDYTSTSSFEFHRGERVGLKPIAAPYLNKVAPSKWDEAEKWLVSASPSETLTRPRAKSGPIYGQGVVNFAKRAPAPNQQEWQLQPEPTKHGVHVGSLDNGVDDDHFRNAIPITAPHPEPSLEYPAEWTKKMDAIKASGNGTHNFAFIPVPAPASVERSVDCYPLADEPSDMKEVGVSHEQSYCEPFSKSMPQTRKPTSDSIVAPPPFAMPASTVRSVSMRDMGTEMTPIASQEPSRTGTPIRATTPTVQSPISSSCSSTPRRASPVASPTQGSEDGSYGQASESNMILNAGEDLHGLNAQHGKVNAAAWSSKEEEDADASKSLKTIDLEEVKKNVLETRAASWEEAEKSKYMARFKREEAKIQAWENHEKAKAEAELRRIEVKVERLRSHAHEKLMNKMAAARRKAEERRALAEAKKCEEAAKTVESADYIRRTGRVPSSFFSCGLCR